MKDKGKAQTFSVGDHGQPHLEGEEGNGSQEPQEGQEGQENVRSEPESTVVQPEELWTPQEAQQLLHTIWNLGFFFYGVDWLAQPHDFLRSAPDTAWVLDRVLPKSIGGPLGWGIHLSSIAADAGMSIALRRELLKKGPKSMAENIQEATKRWEQPPGQAGQQPPAAPPPPPPAPTPGGTPDWPGASDPGTAAPAPAAADSFAFDPALRAAIDANPYDGGVFSDMGIPT